MTLSLSHGLAFLSLLLLLSACSNNNSVCAFDGRPFLLPRAVVRSATTSALSANYLDSISNQRSSFWSPGESNREEAGSDSSTSSTSTSGTGNATETTTVPTLSTASTSDPIFSTDLEEFLSQSKAHLQQAMHNFNHASVPTGATSGGTASSSTAYEQQAYSFPVAGGSTPYMRDLLTPRHKQATKQVMDKKGSSWTTGEALSTSSSSDGKDYPRTTTTTSPTHTSTTTTTTSPTSPTIASEEEKDARKSAAWQAYLAYKESMAAKSQPQQQAQATDTMSTTSMNMQPAFPSALASYQSSPSYSDEPPRSTSSAYAAYLAYKAQKEQRHSQQQHFIGDDETSTDDFAQPLMPKVTAEFTEDYRIGLLPNNDAETMDTQATAQQQPPQYQPHEQQDPMAQQYQQGQQQQGQQQQPPPQYQQRQQQQQQPRQPPPPKSPVYKHSVTNTFEDRLSKLHSGNQVVQPRVRQPKSSSQQSSGYTPMVRATSSSSSTSGGGSQSQQQPLVQSGGGAFGAPDFLEQFNKRASQLHQQSQSGALSGGYSSFDDSGGRVPAPPQPNRNNQQQQQQQQQQQRSSLMSSGTGAWEDPQFQWESQRQQQSFGGSSGGANRGAAPSSPKGGQQPLVQSGGGAWGEPDFLDQFNKRTSMLHQQSQSGALSGGYSAGPSFADATPQWPQQNQNQRQPQQQNSQSSYSGGGGGGGYANEPLVTKGGGYDALAQFEARASRLHTEGPNSGMYGGGGNGGGGGMMNQGGGGGSMMASSSPPQSMQGPSNANRAPQQRWSPGSNSGGSEPLVSTGGGYDFLKQWEQRAGLLHSQGPRAGAPKMNSDDYFKAQAGGTGASASQASRNQPPPAPRPPPMPQKPKEQPLVSSGGGAWGEPDFLSAFERRASELHQQSQSGALSGGYSQQEGYDSPQPTYQDDQWQQGGQQQDPWQQQQRGQQQQQGQNPAQFLGNQPLVQSGGGYDALAQFQERASKLHVMGPNGGSPSMSSQDYFKAQSASVVPGATVVSSDIGSPVRSDNQGPPLQRQPSPDGEFGSGYSSFDAGYNSPPHTMHGQQQQTQDPWQNSQFSSPQDEPLMSQNGGYDFLKQWEERASRLHTMGPRADSPMSGGGASPGRGGNPSQGNPFRNQGTSRPQGPTTPPGRPESDFWRGPPGMQASSIPENTPQVGPRQTDQQLTSDSDSSFMQMIEDRKYRVLSDLPLPGPPNSELPSRPGFVNMLKEPGSERRLGDATFETPGSSTTLLDDDPVNQTESALGPPPSSACVKILTALAENEEVPAFIAGEGDFHPSELGTTEDFWAPDPASILEHQSDEQQPDETVDASSDDHIPPEFVNLHPETNDGAKMEPTDPDHLLVEFVNLHTELSKVDNDDDSSFAADLSTDEHSASDCSNIATDTFGEATPIILGPASASQSVIQPAPVDALTASEPIEDKDAVPAISEKKVAKSAISDTKTDVAIKIPTNVHETKFPNLQLDEPGRVLQVKAMDKSTTVVDGILKMLDSVILPWTGRDDDVVDELPKDATVPLLKSDRTQELKMKAETFRSTTDADVPPTQMPQPKTIAQAEPVAAASRTAPSASPSDWPDFVDQIETRRNRMHIWSMGQLSNPRIPKKAAATNADVATPVENNTDAVEQQPNPMDPPAAIQESPAPQNAMNAPTRSTRRRNPPDGEDFESMFDNTLANGLPGRGKPPIRRATPFDMTNPKTSGKGKAASLGRRPPLKSEFTSNFDSRRKKLNKETPK